MPTPSTPSEVERLALRRGIFFVREGKGAHRIHRNDEGRRLVISFKKGRDLPIGTLRSTIFDMGISIEEFNEQI